MSTSAMFPTTRRSARAWRRGVLVAGLSGFVAAVAVSRAAAADAVAAEAVPERRWDVERRELVEEIRRQGIKDERVLAALGSVPRHLFVPEDVRPMSYRDQPLPIGHGQTISQPYVVAFMTEAAAVKAGANVLEVGTGSGYQAAVLAEVLGLGPGGGSSTSRLASIEIVPALAQRSKEALAAAGYRVEVKQGDGYRGWPEKAPFDAIVVTAAPDHVPQPLKDQLAVGGRLVIPVGDAVQHVRVITRTQDGYRDETILPVRFVPMTGEAEGRR